MDKNYYSYRVGDSDSYGYVSLIADTEEDIAKISVENLSPGSTIIIADTANVYILNTKKEWKQL